jgi:hypothetical protein
VKWRRLYPKQKQQEKERGGKGPGKSFISTSSTAQEERIISSGAETLRYFARCTNAWRSCFFSLSQKIHDWMHTIIGIQREDFRIRFLSKHQAHTCVCGLLHPSCRGAATCFCPCTRPGLHDEYQFLENAEKHRLLCNHGSLEDNGQADQGSRSTILFRPSQSGGVT